MHKTITLSTVLFILAGSFLADVCAKADIDFNGDVQYRLRYHYAVIKKMDGKDSSATPDFSNRYAWNLKLKVTANENLLFGVRLSNPSGYAATDNIADNITWVTKGNYNLLSIPELYFKWTAGILSLSAGIIPVSPNTVFNLIAYESNGYGGVGITSWAVLMNNSQKGLDVGLDIYNTEAFSIGMDLVAAMADDAKGTDKADAFLLDQLRFVLSIPTSMAAKKVSLLPVMHVRTNLYRSEDLDKANHSIAGGCDLNVKLIEAFGVKLGLAGGMYNNSCQENDDSADIDQDVLVDAPVTLTSPLGILFNSGITVLPGFGKAMVNFSFGRSRDREDSPVINNDLLFWDIKYAMPIKKLTIMPRVRIWYFPETEKKPTEARLRPELIFMASF